MEMALTDKTSEMALDKADILIVDDSEQNRAVLAGHIRLIGHTSRDAENGLLALAAMRAQTPDLILLDLNMPVMDGVEVLGEMESDSVLSGIPVVIISGNDDPTIISECIRRGADDYLVKPFQPRILRARIENSLAKLRFRQKERALHEMTERYNEELKERVQAQVRQITEAQLSTIFALSTLAESRDPETGAHLERMRSYCALLASELATNGPYAGEISRDFADLLYSASPLHDIGKVGVPDNVLCKPGKLTEDEYAIMQTHCQLGADTLRRLKDKFPDNTFLAMGYEIALYHHEKWNGKGYPSGLRENAIPLSARILALCDVYDALTSKRCYKDAMSHEASAAIIYKERGEHFDPAIVDAFHNCELQFQEICRQFQD
ncbi:MAG: hypothetical protein AMXMBFR84_15220 [Candidatus Hydrogenedentota bacterium]